MVLLLAGLSPILLMAVLIHCYGVNVPYGDEWSLTPLFQHWNSGQAGFAELWAQHNEHRIVVPKLVYLAFAYGTHWNLRAEMFFSLFLCVLTAGGLYVIVARTIEASASVRLAVWALLNLFLFSPIQGENWLWGFQLQIFLPNLCLIGAVVCVSSCSGETARLLAAAAFTVLGSFSFGGALLLWPVILLLLILWGTKPQYVAVWIALATSVIWIYFRGYQTHPPPASLFGRFEYLIYFAAFLGTPFVGLPVEKGLALPVIAGSAATLAYLAAVVYFSRKRNVWRNCAPWFAIGAYALLSAATTARSRINFGPAQAMDSRYTTVSTTLLLALLGLTAVALFGKRDTPEPSKSLVWGRLGAVALISGLLTLYGAAFPRHIEYLQALHRAGQQGKAALEFISPARSAQIVSSKLATHLDPVAQAQYAEILDELELLKPRLRRTAFLEDAEDRARRSTDEYGQFEVLQKTIDGKLLAAGWAYLGPEDLPASSVVLAYASENKWLVFSLADTLQARPDLAIRKRNRSFFDRGWIEEFDPALLPAGAREITAWAVDANRGLTYRLPNSYAIP